VAFADNAEQSADDGSARVSIPDKAPGTGFVDSREDAKTGLSNPISTQLMTPEV